MDFENFKRPNDIMFEEQKYVTDDPEGFDEIEDYESIEEFPVRFTAEYQAMLDAQKEAQNED